MTNKEHRKYLVEMTEAIDNVIDKYIDSAEEELLSRNDFARSVMKAFSKEDSKCITRCTLYAGLYVLIGELLNEQLDKMSEQGAKIALEKSKHIELAEGLRDLAVPDKENMN